MEEMVQRLETQGKNFRSPKSVLLLPPTFYNYNVDFCCPYVYKQYPVMSGL